MGGRASHTVMLKGGSNVKGYVMYGQIIARFLKVGDFYFMNLFLAHPTNCGL